MSGSWQGRQPPTFLWAVSFEEALGHVWSAGALGCVPLLRTIILNMQSTIQRKSLAAIKPPQNKLGDVILCMLLY